MEKENRKTPQVMVRGIKYRIVPATHTGEGVCFGCAGDHDAQLCGDFPYCGGDGASAVIYVRRGSRPVKTSAAPS